MIKKRMSLVTTLILVTSVSFAETTKEIVGGKDNKPTADEPWKNNNIQQNTAGQFSHGPIANPTSSSKKPLNPSPETSQRDPKNPPVKGVISLKNTINAIDPETEERPLPGSFKNPGLSQVTAIDPETEERPLPGSFKNPGLSKVTAIDPESEERPLPGKGYTPGSKLEVTVWGVGPGKKPGIDTQETALTRTQNSAERPLSKGPAISIPPEVRMQNLGETNAPQFLPPGQVDVLKSLNMARAWAKNLQFGQIKLYSVELTAGAILGSSLLIAYQTLGLGGRQRALAAVVPPQVIMSWTGRSGYRVPGHDVYTKSDVKALAAAIEETTNDEELEELLAEVDPELLNYMAVVNDYVQTAKRMEDQRLYMQMCENPTLCT